MNKELNSRQQQELELIDKANFMSVKDLVENFAVSEMTIRRDISTLSELGLVTQVFGGAISLKTSQNERVYSISQEITKNILLKKSIAKKGLELLSSNDVIFLDSGTSIQALAEAIPIESAFTIITSSFNSLEILVKLPNCTIICPGGVYASKQRMFYNTDTADFFKKHRSNKCFIGATGYDLELGLTCGYMEDVTSKQAMLDASKEKILLLDSTKYDNVGTFVFGGIESFTTVITDKGIPESYQKKITELGIELHIVD